MSPFTEKTYIMSESEYKKLKEKGNVIIKDRIEMGEKCLVTILENNLEKELNISIPIAAAISAYSRIHMTKYIIELGDNLCYIDTDGIKCTCNLDPTEVGEGLGQMKFEGEFKEAVFIAPKVYGGIVNSEMAVKIKGLKEQWCISYWQLKLLLYIDRIEVLQEKMIRQLDKGYISVLKQIYTLSATDNKRELIRDSCGKLIDTRPYHVIDGKIIELEKFILYYLPAPYLTPVNLRINDIKLPILIVLAPVYANNLLLLPPPLVTNNIIYLPAPLPKVIYVKPALPNVIYLEGPTIKLLPAPSVNP
jgi:hypothetical protein